MPQRIEPITGLKYGWDLGESGWNSGTDENWLQVGAMIQPVVINIVNSPATSAEGTVYIVGSSPTGAFAGQGGKLAAFSSGAWRFYAPKDGWTFYNKADGLYYRYGGSTWTAVSIQTPAQPYLEVSNPGTWSFGNTAYTKIPLTNVITDTAESWNAASNTDYNIPESGMYLLQAIVRPVRTGTNALPDATAFGIGVGTTPADSDNVAWGAGIAAGVPFTLSVCRTQRYLAGVTISLFAKHSADGNVSIANARLRVLKLSE
ncbi:tail fiber protein [Klebsiella phage vB_KpnS_MAG26fr]|nr:tail fiber protein [Klebsiella phage vB_KpnS_MAG26fr]